MLHLPGHSMGSIGILTATGDLFCGDLLLNNDKPSPAEMLDDAVDLEGSLKKLQNFSFRTIYPGHGKPFMMEQFLDLQKEIKSKITANTIKKENKLPLLPGCQVAILPTNNKIRYQTGLKAVSNLVYL